MRIVVCEIDRFIHFRVRLRDRFPGITPHGGNQHAPCPRQLGGNPYELLPGSKPGRPGPDSHCVYRNPESLLYLFLSSQPVAVETFPRGSRVKRLLGPHRFPDSSPHLDSDCSGNLHTLTDIVNPLPVTRQGPVSIRFILENRARQFPALNPPIPVAVQAPRSLHPWPR